VRGRTSQYSPARSADQDVTTLDSLPLELEILPADDKAGTQLMVLAHTAKRLKNLEIQTDYSGTVRYSTNILNQCCGSGSGIRCFFEPWIRDPGWVKIRIRDPG
jgi:hypothetical protein